MSDAPVSDEVPHDEAWYEREYNPRVTIPAAVERMAAWGPRAAATRLAHPPLADIPYGPHPRERWDLFRVPEARGTVVYIHGGYWRGLSKIETSWIADGFLGRGLSVALLNYPLCPEVPLGRILEAAVAGFAVLHRDLLTEAERRRVVVVGHSAGGHLAALHVATDWRAHGLPADPIAGAVPISGVFDLPPLVHTTINASLGLDAEEARRLSILGRPWRTRVPVTFVVGGDEPGEFHRQSDAMAAAWSDLAPKRLDIVGANHLTVLDGLAVVASPIHQAVMEMVETD